MQKEIKDKLIEIGYTGKTDLETLLDALPVGMDQEDKRYDLVIW